MSDLYRQLGPQGRALLNSGARLVLPGNGARGVPLVYEYERLVPQDLDFLVSELRDPLPDTSPQKVLGFMYHYLPYIKVEYNLRIVLSSFLNNPVTFGPHAAPFEQNYHIIELFQAVAEKKLKVSQPTLNIKTWYDVVTRELINFVAYNPLQNSWKTLPVVAGLMLAKPIRNQVYSGIEYAWFFRDIDEKLHTLFTDCLQNSLTGYQSDDIINLVLLSYAVVFNKSDENVKSYTGKVAPEFVISKLVDLIFNPKFARNANAYKELLLLDRQTPDSEKQVQDILLQPIIRNLNKLSFLLEAYFTELPFTDKGLKLVKATLNSMLQYNKELFERVSSSPLNSDPLETPQTAAENNTWFFLKNVLFTEVIVFQGILSRFLKTKQRFWFFGSTAQNNTSEYAALSFVILHNLFYTNFILLSVGQGGFDNYNFVYYLAVELALNAVNLEQMEVFTNELVNNPRELNVTPEIINNNYLVTSKVLFVLGLWESYVLHKDVKVQFVRSVIYPFCWRIVSDSKFTNPKIIEGCHSVLLICFSNASLSPGFKETLAYIGVLDSQFPRLLSAQQLSIGIESVGKRLLSSPIKYKNSLYRNSAEELLEFLFFHCGNTTPGIKIPKRSLTTMDSFSSSRPDVEITSPAALRSASAAPGLAPKFEYEMSERFAPETTREAKIIAVISLIPYIPLSSFEKWLNKILSMVEFSNAREREFLFRMFWKTISENLDTNRSELAMRWWYERMHIPQNGGLQPLL